MSSSSDEFSKFDNFFKIFEESVNFESTYFQKFCHFEKRVMVDELNSKLNTIPLLVGDEAVFPDVVHWQYFRRPDSRLTSPLSQRINRNYSKVN